MSWATIACLSALLLLTLGLPLCVRGVEQNLELFLLIMGLAASFAAHALNLQTLGAIFSDVYLYLITAAVFAFGLAFLLLEKKIDYLAGTVLEKIPLKLAVFLLVLTLGLLSCLITAVVASMLLAEVVSMLPIGKKQAARVTITACYAISLGAVLTPVGEPLSTIVTARMGGSFFYLFTLLGPYILPAVALLAFLGAFAVHDWRRDKSTPIEQVDPDRQTFRGIVLRTVKVFAFIVGLELLGAGFQPFIDRFVLGLGNLALYLLNTLSAVLANAALAAAEISPRMNVMQIKTILMSLLISGGMLITGNIPNIVTASRLKIRSKEWALFALPVGVVMMVVYYVVSFTLGL